MPYGKSNKSIQDSAFKMRSGNSTPFKQMGSSPSTSQFTRSLQKRAFGVDVNPRDGAKMLRTSTWNYNKMKKNYERRLTKPAPAPKAEDQSNVESSSKPEVKKEVSTNGEGTEAKYTGHTFKLEGDPWTYRKTIGVNVDGSKFEWLKYSGEWSPQNIDIPKIEEAYNKSLETE